MSQEQNKKTLHQLFEFGVLLKALNGLWETTLGILILLISPQTINLLFLRLTRAEILEDPSDRVVNYFARSLQNISNGTRLFAAIYILLHGVVNLFLAYQLYKQRLWAYLATICVMILFIGYQVYRISLHHSFGLTIITIFDLIFIWLTWDEYRARKLKQT